MRVLSFEDWFDNHGESYADFIASWLEERPSGISLQSLSIYDMDDFINEKVLEAYEDYVSEVEDEEYERYKDEKCFYLVN